MVSLRCRGFIPPHAPAQSTPPHTSRETVRLATLADIGFIISDAVSPTAETSPDAVNDDDGWVAGVLDAEPSAAVDPAAAPPAARCARRRASSSMPPMRGAVRRTDSVSSARQLLMSTDLLS